LNLHASEFPWSLESLFLTSMSLRGSRPSLLVNCSDAEVSQVAGELAKRCEAPLQRVSLPGRLDLPSTFHGTLLLMRLEEMSIEQQITLFDWLTKAQCRVQVISIATTRIDGLVRDGRFLEGLFYRLNIVQLEARASRHDRPRVDPFPMDCRELDIDTVYS
jgi:transcriptional regulator of aromatic amino acid metabolism